MVQIYILHQELYKYQWIFPDERTASTSSITLTEDSNVGLYKLKITDTKNSSISQTVTFEVKSIEINIGIQGKITNTSEANKFVGTVYSKDDNQFHMYHNNNSAITSVENIVDDKFYHSKLKTSNMETNFGLNEIFRSSVALNSDDTYAYSSSGKHIVEIFSIKTTQHILMYKSFVYDDSDEMYKVECKEIIESTKESFYNVKLALSTDGLYFMISYYETLSASESTNPKNLQMIIYKLDSNKYTHIITREFEVTDSSDVEDSYINCKYACFLFETYFKIWKFDSSNILYSNILYSIHHDINNGIKIYMNEREKVFIETIGKQIHEFIMKVNKYYPYRVFDNTIMFEKSSPVYSLFYDESNNRKHVKTINYGNKEYTVLRIIALSQYINITIIEQLTNNYESVYIYEFKELSIVDDILNFSGVDNNDYIYIHTDSLTANSIMLNIIENSTLTDVNPKPFEANLGLSSLVASLQTFHSLCISKKTTNNILELIAYEVNSFVKLGENISGYSDVTVGQNISSNNKYNNQVIIGSGARGISDNSVVLGNKETLRVIPSRNGFCDLGSSSLKYNTLFSNKISFGDDEMNLPDGDGEESQILIRRGPKNLSWEHIRTGRVFIDDIIDAHASTNEDYLKYNLLMPAKISYTTEDRQKPSGNRNTFFGFQNDLYYKTFDTLSGNDNTCVGYNSGKSLKSGRDNIVIGSGASVGPDNTNSIVIGKGSSCTEDNTIVLGNDNHIKIIPHKTDTCNLGSTSKKFGGIYCVKIDAETYIRCKGPISSYSDSRLKNNIFDLPDENSYEFIKKLRPVSFILKHTQKEQIGFIAQDVEKVSRDTNVNGIIDNDENDLYTLNYQALIAPMVKTIQRQNRIIEDLEKRLSVVEHKFDQ